MPKGNSTNRKVTKKKKKKRNQKEILELKNIIAEMKNSLEGFNSTFEQATDRSSTLEDRKIEIMQSEQKGE